MDIGVISVRYARALFKGSCDAKLEDVVCREMQTLAKSFIDVPRLRLAIENPMVSKDTKASLLSVAAGGAPCDLTKAFFNLVLKEGRESVMQFMANSFITLCRRHKNLVRGKLTTAVPVSADTERRLRQMVEARTKGTVEFETEIDPGIIGGFVLEYDTYRMDASVKSRLKTVLAQLK